MKQANIIKNLKNFEIDLDDIPEKYMSMIYSWLNNIP